jgi:hypothetical protein
MAAPAERSVTVPSQSGGDAVCITSSELRELSVVDVKDLLKQEKAPMETWIALMLEYWRLGQRKQFESMLRDVLQPSIVPVGEFRVPLRGGGLRGGGLAGALPERADRPPLQGALPRALHARRTLSLSRSLTHAPPRTLRPGSWRLHRGQGQAVPHHCRL